MFYGNEVPQMERHITAIGGKVVLQQAMNLRVIKQKCTWDQDNQDWTRGNFISTRSTARVIRAMSQLSGTRNRSIQALQRKHLRSTCVRILKRETTAGVGPAAWLLKESRAWTRGHPEWNEGHRLCLSGGMFDFGWAGAFGGWAHIPVHTCIVHALHTCTGTSTHFLSFLPSFLRSFFLSFFLSLSLSLYVYIYHYISTYAHNICTYIFTRSHIHTFTDPLHTSTSRRWRVGGGRKLRWRWIL